MSFGFKGFKQVMPMNVYNSKIYPSILKQHTFRLNDPLQNPTLDVPIMEK
jgi:hypothetical protein